MKNNTKIFIASELLYFVVSMSTMIVGTNLEYLKNVYNQPISKITLFASIFALGRITTCNISAQLADRFGPKKVMLVGSSFIALYCIGIMIAKNYVIGMILSFLAGIGQGVQDVVSPYYLNKISGKDYSRNLSIGQILYAGGCFAVPFLVSLLLKLGLPVIYSNYIILIFPIITIIISLFIIDTNNEEILNNEEVLEIRVKHKNNSLILLGLASLTFTAINTGINMFTTTYGVDIGLTEANAALLLTIFNVGAILGGVAFSKLLDKYLPENVFLFCAIGVSVLLIACYNVNSLNLYFTSYFLSGFLLGDLFAVILILATGIYYDKIGFISSYVAITSGISDVLLTPIISKIVENNGSKASIYYVVAVSVICAFSAYLLKKEIKRGKKGWPKRKK